MIRCPVNSSLAAISGEDCAVEALYHTFLGTVRYYLTRQLGWQDAEDAIHDSFAIVLKAIRCGSIREPSALMAFVWAIVRRQEAAHVKHIVRGRKQVVLDRSIPGRHATPEEVSITQQCAAIGSGVLRRMPARDREILTRFYIMEQTRETICVAMGLSETQFRILKSRAKARFGNAGKALTEPQKEQPCLN